MGLKIGLRFLKAPKPQPINGEVKNRAKRHASTFTPP